MKILYFHQHFSTPKGAVGIRSYEMARRLVKRGHEVVMVCGSYTGGQTGLTQEFRRGVRKGKVNGIDVVEFELCYSNSDSFAKRTLLFFRFALKSIKIALVEKYDLVFATTTPLTASIPGIFAKWLRRKPFVFEVRDLWPELPRAMGVITNPLILWGMGLLEWVAYKSADRLIALSPGIKRGITRFGESDSKAILIPNGCDLDIFSNKDNRNSRLKWRPEQVKDSDFMAVYSGTHGRANGLVAVIEVAKILKEKARDDIKLVLIGQGADKNDLEKLAEEKQLNNVIFLDPVDKAKLAGLLNASDLGLQLLANVPSFYYGTSPNKFFDYLAAGLPVLTNYPGWVADIINESCCGVAVSPDDPKLFANTLIELSSDGSRLKTLGRAASKLAKSKFDRKQLSAKFAIWLESTAGQTV